MNDTSTNTAGAPLRLNYRSSILTEKEIERMIQQAEEVKRSGGRLCVEQSQRNQGELYIKTWH